MASSTGTTRASTSRSGTRRAAAARLPRYPRKAAPPVLVEVHRGEIVESRHRGHVVQVAADGRIERGIGDPDLVTSLRSAVKPFALVALLESGAADALKLSDQELAVMAASHSGEDAHVRTLQGVFRRAGLSQSLLANGTADAPLDEVTAARLAREGESPSPIRHMCSGFHAASLLISRHAGWSLSDYWRPEHPSQRAVADVVGRVFGRSADELATGVDSCGLLTYAFPLVDIARAFALLADPESSGDSTSLGLAGHLRRVRDAMIAAPEMVGGSRGAGDTALMRARPGAIVAKSGAEALRGVGLLPGTLGAGTAAAGMAIKIEDGDGRDRASGAVTVEALAQLRVLDPAALERLSDMHRPSLLDPRGAQVGQAVARFELAPIGELV